MIITAIILVENTKRYPEASVFPLNPNSLQRFNQLLPRYVQEYSLLILWPFRNMESSTIVDAITYLLKSQSFDAFHTYAGQVWQTPGCRLVPGRDEFLPGHGLSKARQIHLVAK